MNPQEQQTPLRREQHPGGPRSGLGGLFDEPDEASPLALVANGPYAEHLPVGGMTAGEIRRRFRDRFDIDPRSQAVIDGHDVGDDTVVQPGQTLMFMHRSGEKGRGRRAGLSPATQS
jgi:hypothetical protein